MKYIVTIYFTLSLAICFDSVRGQLNDQNIRKRVLEKAIIGKQFVFRKWSPEKSTETRLKYLGLVKTKQSKVFKIVNSIWVWGLSGRTTSRILIFNGKNQILGNYYVFTTSDLPSRLEDGKLIFINNNDDCDKALTTIVSFRSGIPKRFFRKCKGEDGDIYSFESL